MQIIFLSALQLHLKRNSPFNNCLHIDLWMAVVTELLENANAASLRYTALDLVNSPHAGRTNLFPQNQFGKTKRHSVVDLIRLQTGKENSKTKHKTKVSILRQHKRNSSRQRVKKSGAIVISILTLTLLFSTL